MKTRIFSFIFFSFAFVHLSFPQGNVGIGTPTPNKNAVLELVSPGNNQGLLVPKLSTAQRTATSFTSSLTATENGLLVFDTNDGKFYFWQGSSWQPIGANVLQDLKLTGSTLTITNNPSATPIDLSPFSGTNTDGQTLSYSAATGQLSITTLSSPQSVTITTAGTAGGDLTGIYPSPTLNNNTVTSAKIVDGTIVSADIANGAITAADLSNTSVTPGTYGSATIIPQLTVDAQGRITSVVSTTITGVTPGGAAGGDLTGTYPSPTLNNNTVTSAKIVDGTIVSADIANGTITSADLSNTAVTPGTYGSATVIPQLTVDAQGRISSVVNTTISGVTPGGAASGDLTGTYPGPTVNTGAITSSKIADGTIADADVSTTAALSVAKLSIGTTGQVLTTSGLGIPQWANPSGSVLINNAGVRNLFAGQSVGGSSGTDNAFFGFNAGNANTTGNYNVIIGAGAGQDKTAGNLNTLIGWLAGQALGNVSTYNGNTFLGAQAGLNSTDGPSTFLGEKSGMNNSTGTLNLFVGNSAGLTNTAGTENTILGYTADVASANLQNAIAIGYNTKVDASNKVRLGNTVITVIEGQVPFTSASDKRFKKDIQPLSAGVDFIGKLHPVSYKMKNAADKKTNWGFIAQDVMELVGNENAVVTVASDEAQSLGLRYTDFIAPLVKAVQEQQLEIEQLHSQVATQRLQISKLESALQELKSDTAEIASVKDQVDKIKKSLGL